MFKYNSTRILYLILISSLNTPKSYHINYSMSTIFKKIK
nr:MAG TPA: hypothetical protein [Bacteriophage sp.]